MAQLWGLADVHLFWLTVAAVAAVTAVRRSAPGPGGPVSARERSPPQVAGLVRGRARSGAGTAAGLVASGALRVGRPGPVTTMGLSAGGGDRGPGLVTM